MTVVENKVMELRVVDRFRILLEIKLIGLHSGCDMCALQFVELLWTGTWLLSNKLKEQRTIAEVLGAA